MRSLSHAAAAAYDDKRCKDETVKQKVIPKKRRRDTPASRWHTPKSGHIPSIQQRSSTLRLGSFITRGGGHPCSIALHGSIILELRTGLILYFTVFLTHIEEIVPIVYDFALWRLLLFSGSRRAASRMRLSASSGCCLDGVAFAARRPCRCSSSDSIGEGEVDSISQYENNSSGRRWW